MTAQEMRDKQKKHQEKRDEKSEKERQKKIVTEIKEIKRLLEQADLTDGNTYIVYDHNNSYDIKYGKIKHRLLEKETKAYFESLGYELGTTYIGVLGSPGLCKYCATISWEE